MPESEKSQALGQAGDFVRDLANYVGRRTPGLLLLVAAGAVLEGASLFLLVPLLGTLFAGDNPLSGLPAAVWTLLPAVRDSARLPVILLLFGGVMGLRALVLWQRDLRLGALQIGYLESKRSMLAQALADSRWSELNAMGHGRITHLMSGDIQRCAAGVHFLLQGSVAVVLVVVQAAVAVMLAPQLALVALGFLAIGAVVMGRWLGATRDIGAKVTAANMAIMVELGRFLGGLKAAMSQNMDAAFVVGFRRDLDLAARQQIAFVNRQAALRVMWSLLGAAVACGVLMLGYFVLRSPPAVLLALLVVLARVAGPAAQIQSGMQQIAYALPAWQALRQILTELPVRDRPKSQTQRGLPRLCPVRFDAVTCLHTASGGQGGIRNLSITLTPGDMIAVGGSSGAGKTTFADLLAGLLEPQEGRITVGDQRLDAGTVPDWRTRLAYVTQDPLLFNDTVRTNLLWGGVEADEAAIARALELTGADQVVDRMPQGLDSIVGENGALVSGGERQRLALSRALLRRPEVMILDEATSALDADSEAAVLAALAALEPRPLIVVISHRPQVLAACDRRLTFEAGRLIDDTRR